MDLLLWIPVLVYAALKVAWGLRATANVFESLPGLGGAVVLLGFNLEPFSIHLAFVVLALGMSLIVLPKLRGIARGRSFR